MNTCPACGGKATEESFLEKFEYGFGLNSAMLEATMPLLTCADCGFRFTDERGEEAREAAVQKYLAGKKR